jgi:hypothetical protein
MPRRLRAPFVAGPALLLVIGLACGGGGNGPAPPPPGGTITKAAGDAQTGVAGSVGQALAVLVTDSSGQPESGISVSWQVLSGCGAVSPGTSVSDATGFAQTIPTLGLPLGIQQVQARTPGYTNSPLTFTLTATAPPGGGFTVLGGCDNVPARYSSDLWVAAGYAYTGTWNWIPRTAGVGGAIEIFQLDGAGTPLLVDSILLPNVTTVSDLQVSPDSSWLVVTTEGNSAQGLYVYSLANRRRPALRAFRAVSTGLHTGTLSVLGGKLYAFTARNPANPALLIFDLSGLGTGTITLADSVPIPPNYGIHDTFVRDGICFAFVWNEGVYIYDVGDGMLGGSPEDPRLISSIKTGGGEAHNGWWFHNPSTGEQRYLFVGQEGPATIGTSSSGDIHVVDVSNLSAPVEVGSYSMPGAGTHNFWMDEAQQRLYAAYYNGGVVALDVSGTLAGNLASREIARVRPGGTTQTDMWGVMLHGNSLYALDMLSGLWQLGVP